MTSYLESIPHPWTREVIEAAIFDSFSDARRVIDETEGGKIWRSLQDLEDSIWIVEVSTTELLEEICLFGERSKNTMFWQRANNREADAHTRTVKRKLFNCTSAIMALVDSARNFERKFPVPGYIDRRTSSFPIVGLHDFLQCLRNYGSHWRIVQAHWTIKHDFRNKKREAHFSVAKSELLQWSKWTTEARKFIANASEDIDIYNAFSNYRELVQDFYVWHRGAVLNEYINEIRAYLEYKRLYEGFQGKVAWNLILSHARKDLKPYEHIGRYLPKEQVERILTYPPRSEIQVRAIVQMMGMEDFCDETLFNKLFALFQKPTAA